MRSKSRYVDSRQTVEYNLDKELFEKEGKPDANIF